MPGALSIGMRLACRAADIAVDRARRHFERVGERRSGQRARRRPHRLDDVEEAIGSAHAQHTQADRTLSSLMAYPVVAKAKRGAFGCHRSISTSSMRNGPTAVPFYGPNAIYDGHEIVQLKILSDPPHRGWGHRLARKIFSASGQAHQDRGQGVIRRVRLQPRRGTDYEVGHAYAVIGRLHPQSQGSAAQRFDRRRDGQPGNLPGRARRGCVARSNRSHSTLEPR
jgi:hypothetical protein